MVAERILGSEIDMTETLTPHDAARVLAETSRYEDALAERTGGITWIIWGLVTPAIFLTYAFAYTINPEGHPAFAFLWMPWVAAGMVATGALWRSVAISAPGLRQEGASRIWLKWIAASVVLWIAMFLMPSTGANEPLLLIGLFWMAMGTFNLFGGNKRARVVATIAGALIVATAAALVALAVPVEVGGTVAIVVSGVVPIAAGLLHAFRG